MMNKVSKFMNPKVTNPENISRDNKNQDVYHDEQLQSYNKKEEIEIDDIDKGKGIYDKHPQKMQNGQFITKIKEVSTRNRNITNLGSECVQSNNRRHIVIANVVNYDHEDDSDKDEELYNEADPVGNVAEITTTKGYETSKSVCNAETTKQHDGELHDD